MEGVSASRAKPMASMMSCGAKLPRVACPRVRISVMVITTVISTIKVAPKLRESSLRTEEWNNMRSASTGPIGFGKGAQAQTLLATERTDYEL